MQTSVQDNKQAQQQTMHNVGSEDVLSSQLSGRGYSSLSPDNLRSILRGIVELQQNGGSSGKLMQLLQKVLEIIILLGKFGSGSASAENQSVSSGMSSGMQKQSGDASKQDTARKKLQQTLKDLDIRTSFGPADTESVEEESPQTPVIPDDVLSADFTAPVNKDLYDENVRQHSYHPSELLTETAEKNAIFAEKENPGTAEEKRQLAIDAEIAAYPYHRSAEKIAEAAAINQDSEDASPNWSPVTDLIDDLAEKTGLSADKEKGYLYDESTGLTAYLLQDAASGDNQDIRLAFGGTTSGHETGGLGKRSWANRKFSAAQWKSNIQNALGLKIPGNFQQAKELTAAVSEGLKAHPQYGDSKLTLTGHSKGGAEAAYAALSQATPLEAKIFSSAELHQKLLDTIPEENLNQASGLITGANIKGDFVPNMRKILPTNIHPVGSTVTLPPAHAYNLERHDTFAKHIRHFAKTR